MNIKEKFGPNIDVPKILTREQIQFYVDNGYIVVPDLINAEELEELKTDIVKVARGHYPAENYQSVPDDISDTEIMDGVLCIHQPHYISPVIEKYCKHPKICGVLSQVVGAHLAHWDGSVKCMQSMYFVKPPGFQGQAWHQDERYIPTRDRTLTGAWIAVDDATIENGTLWVIPGSHKDGFIYPWKSHGNFDEFDIHDQTSYGFDESKQAALECKAGSVVFFNGYLLHQSCKNRSNSYRRVLVNHYLNAWALLPWTDTKDKGWVAIADDRRVIPVSGIDPYAWKGYEIPERQLYVRHSKAIEERMKSGKFSVKTSNTVPTTEMQNVAKHDKKWRTN